MSGENSLPNDKRLCECGCGTIIPRKKGGHSLRFARHHHCKGKLNYRWKGWHLNSSGYIMIYFPTHPKANYRGYIQEHRLVYEQYHKCCLLDYAIVHHINEITTDNLPDNLEAMVSGRHQQVHHIVDMSSRVCVDCHSNETTFQKARTSWTVPRPFWHQLDEINWICHSCYMHLYNQIYVDRRYKTHKRNK